MTCPCLTIADVVLCRNALDHVPDPGEMLSQIRRILKGDGAFYLSVDVGGSPTPDEPTVFLADGRSALVGESFEILTRGEDHRPHSAGRVGAVRILASKRQAPIEYLDKEAVLGAYLAQLKGDP
jgi:SAM-dependent methyltransferase